MTAPATGPVTHRRPSWSRRAGRRIGAALLILATLALGHEITVRTPDRTVTGGYFLRSGGVGERVESLDLAATLVSVRGGSAVVSQRGEELHTNGLWIVARVRLETLTEPHLLLHFAIVDRRGRTYKISDRMFQSVTGYTFQPGIPIEGDLVFELARDAVPGARLRLHQDLVAGTDYETMINIDLGLSEASVAEFLAADEPVRVQPEEVKL